MRQMPFNNGREEKRNNKYSKYCAIFKSNSPEFMASRLFILEIFVPCFSQVQNFVSNISKQVIFIEYRLLVALGSCPVSSLPSTTYVILGGQIASFRRQIKQWLSEKNILIGSRRQDRHLYDGSKWGKVRISYQRKTLVEFYEDFAVMRRDALFLFFFYLFKCVF